MNIKRQDINTGSSKNETFTKSEQKTQATRKERGTMGKKDSKRTMNTTIKHTKIQLGIGRRDTKEKRHGLVT